MLLKDSRTCHPKICHFGIMIIWSYRHLKNSRCRVSLSLNSSICLNTDAPKWSPLLQFPSLGMSSAIITGEEVRSRCHILTNVCHRLSYLPSVLLRISSSFPQIIYFPPRGLHPPPHSLLRWYLSLHFSYLQEWLIFPWVSLVYAWGVHVNKLGGSFLLFICFLLHDLSYEL